MIWTYVSWRIPNRASLTVTRGRSGEKSMHPDISAFATSNGRLTAFWAKLFSRTLVAQADRRRFNHRTAQQNHAGKRPEKQAQTGAFQAGPCCVSRQMICRRRDYD